MLATMSDRSFVVTIAYIKTEAIQAAIFGLIFLVAGSIQVVLMPLIGKFAPRADGRHAQFGTLLPLDAAALTAMGAHHNVKDAVFTTDGNDVRLPAATDHFPDSQTNVVPIQLSMGAWNTLQQSDGHAIGKTVIGGLSGPRTPLFRITSNDLDRNIIAADFYR